MVALILPGTEIADGGSFLIAVVVGFAIVFVGFAAASRVRPIEPRSISERAWAAIWAVVLGAVLGLANLVGNYAIASLDPAIKLLLEERFATLPLLTGLVAAPVTEEIMMRLFFMSSLAWLVSQVTRRRSFVFLIALVIASVVFAALHLDRPMPEEASLATLYRTALMVKYTSISGMLGWAFWRWGLPYAILCHAMANAAHVAIEPLVFG